jgi:hypothetical protein
MPTWSKHGGAHCTGVSDASLIAKCNANMEQAWRCASHLGEGNYICHVLHAIAY